MSRNRPEDRELWEKVKATVKPLRAQSLHEDFGQQLQDMANASVDHAPQPVKKKNSIRLPARASREAPVSISLAPQAPRTIEPSIQRRIVRGRIEIDRRIDLHGLTQFDAHFRLLNFVEQAHRDGNRTVLVITGKGQQGQGILRSVVPRWLAEPEFQKFVSGSSKAHISHGGAGALYVRIRSRNKRR